MIPPPLHHVRAGAAGAVAPVDRSGERVTSEHPPEDQCLSVAKHLGCEIGDASQVCTVMHWRGVGERAGRAEVGDAVALHEVDDSVDGKFASAVTDAKPFILPRVVRPATIQLEDYPSDGGWAFARRRLLDDGALEFA